jgi:uncharacterized membrane protein
MFTNRLTNIVFVFCIAAALILPIYYYPNLPEKVLSHFNFYGKVDDLISKDYFILFNYTLIIFILALFLWINRIIKKVPDSMINLPNKEYWLAAERKAESLNVFRKFLFWSCSLNLLFITLLMHRSYSISVSKSSELGSEIWIYIGLYITVEIFLAIKLIMHFNSIRNQP